MIRKIYRPIHKRRSLGVSVAEESEEEPEQEEEKETEEKEIEEKS